MNIQMAVLFAAALSQRTGMRMTRIPYNGRSSRLRTSAPSSAKSIREPVALSLIAQGRFFRASFEV